MIYQGFFVLIGLIYTELYEFSQDCFYFRLASDPSQKQNRINPAEFWAVFSVSYLLFYEPRKGISEPTLNIISQTNGNFYSAYISKNDVIFP